MRGRSATEPGRRLVATPNPQRIDLGRIGLGAATEPDAPLETDPTCLADVRQRLDLWTGVDRQLASATAARSSPSRRSRHPTASTVAFRIESELLRDGRARRGAALPVRLRRLLPDVGLGVRPSGTRRPCVAGGPGHAVVERALDATSYRGGRPPSSGSLRPGDGAAHLRAARAGRDARARRPVRTRRCRDAAGGVASTPSRHGAAGWWEAFWLSGAAIDLAGSADPRAHELERRLVLSQYLTAVNCAGAMPPQETGLVTNSWQGKFHLEMHFWHAAHFAAWGRPQLLERSLGWYRSIAGQARGDGDPAGVSGARWPKHVGPDGRESPDPTGSLLIWQQPHLPYLLELVWAASAADRRPALVAEFADLVEETADFMAAFAEERDGVFHLGPPVMPAQEFYEAAEDRGPHVRARLLVVGSGGRPAVARAVGARRGTPSGTACRPLCARPPSWTAATPPWPGARRSAATTTRRCSPRWASSPRRRSSTRTPWRRPWSTSSDDWQWPSAWGWDFPVMAMTATRVGRPDLAVEALLEGGPTERPHRGRAQPAARVVPADLPAGERRTAGRGLPHGDGVGGGRRSRLPGRHVVGPQRGLRSLAERRDGVGRRAPGRDRVPEGVPQAVPPRTRVRKGDAWSGSSASPWPRSARSWEAIDLTMPRRSTSTVVSGGDHS